MRFSYTLSLISLLIHSASAFPSSSDICTRHENKRLVTADICATIDVSTTATAYTCTRKLDRAPVNPVGLVSTLGVTCVSAGSETVILAPNLCLCLDSGVLTTQSIANLALQVGTTSIAVLRLTLPYAGRPAVFSDVNSLLNSLQAGTQANIGGRTTSCIYPMEGTPSSCTDCGFTCPLTSRPCGRKCVPFADTCISGVNFRRRDQLAVSPDDRCPKTMSACAIPSAQYFNGRNFECIDTRSDLESCGACAYPLPGQPIGKDCTSIPHTLAVNCVDGECVIDSCERGFELQDGNTTCMPLSVEQNYKKWRKDIDAVARRQVDPKKLKARVFKVGLRGKK